MSSQQISFETETPIGRLNPKSVLDYFILNLKPVIQKQTIKKEGMKITRTILGTTVDNSNLDLKTLTFKQRTLLIEQLGEMPSWFDKDEYLERVWKSYSDFLDNNKELKDNLENLNQQTFSESNIQKVRRVIDLLYNHTVDTSEEWYSKSMAEFLESNLPFELYDTYNISFLARLNMLEAIKFKFRKLQTSIYLTRSNLQRFRHSVSIFKTEMTPLVIARLKSSDTEDLLRFYIKINNAKKMDDLFNIIPLDVKNLDAKKFKTYYKLYKQYTDELLDVLDHLYQSEPHELAYPKSTAIKNFHKDLGNHMLKYA